MALPRVCRAALAVHLALPLAAAGAEEASCQWGGCRDEAAELPQGLSLLQSRATGHSGSSDGESETEESAATGWCPGQYVHPDLNTQPVIDKGLFNNSHVAWWSMPVQQDLEILQRLHAKLEPIEPFASKNMKDVQTGGMGPATEVARMMYEATKVPGVTDAMPEKFRGVFWMKGNAIAEELAVLQNGMWFEEEGLLVVPQTPFSWAMPGGTPKRPPWGGKAYSDDMSSGMANAHMYSRGVPGLSVRFSSCRHARRNSRSLYCDSGSRDKLAFGYMQSHSLGSLREAANYGDMVPGMLGLPSSLGSVVAGAFTLQELPDSVNGSRWKRVCTWGIGRCAFFEFGSYHLLKIIDADGNPLEPEWSKFLKYIGDTPLIVWSGWKNQTVKDTSERAYKRYVARHSHHESTPLFADPFAEGF